MLSSDDCDDCKPSELRHLDPRQWFALAISSFPFAFTLAVVVIIAKRRIFPLLSQTYQDEDTVPALPVFNKEASKAQKPISWRGRIRKPSAQKLASWVFALSIGLSGVLVELLLCEIVNILSPVARAVALKTSLVSLLILSVLITPALEISVIVERLFGSGNDFSTASKTRSNLRAIISYLAFVIWLATFWYIPQISVLRKRLDVPGQSIYAQSFTEACLERIGIIGISLMASLSGFAAVSSLWQTFGTRYRQVQESDILRKETGLSATSEMLEAKRSRIRALRRRLAENLPAGERPGIMGRFMESIRGGNSESQELRALEVEVSGLVTMQYGLSSSVANLRSRYTEQQRAQTSVGKLWNIFNTGFAIYCAYRIGATSISSLRRWWQPDHSFATGDPINNLLAILTTHWDSDLDRDAWSRQFSFLLSGIMLLASFNAVVQTFRLFARFTPNLVKHARTSLPLVISQIAGTYVISSALLLRSNLPEEVRSVISDALGAPLEARFVEGWFESWFLVAVGLTAIGILIGRKVGNANDWDEFDDGVEMGGHKRS